MKKVIQTIKAPGAIGPYSQGIQLGDLFFFSGQIALHPETNLVEEGGIETQTHRVMKNIGALLESSGLSFADVAKTTIFLKNFNDFATVNKIYGEYFPQPYPARSTVEVSRLPKDVLIEIECIAGKKQ